MTNAKVGQVIDIEKLKAEKATTAKKCCVEGCENIGGWDSKGNNFYLIKDMCSKHFRRTKKHGDPNIVSCIRDEKRCNNPLYTIYASMIQRCNNPNCSSYKNYGGRGIVIATEWQGVKGFSRFVLDMGIRPANHTLDRKDVNGNYSKENCRWETVHGQAANKRNNNTKVGVSYDAGYKTWRVMLTVNKIRYRKAFKSKQDAIDYRIELEKKYLQNGV